MCYPPAAATNLVISLGGGKDEIDCGPATTV